MKEHNLIDLQASVQDKTAFRNLEEYALLCREYLSLIKRINPTRIVSPSSSNYIFFQYDNKYSNRITRPINSDLFIESPDEFDKSWESLIAFLSGLRKHQEKMTGRISAKKYLDGNPVNKIVYTLTKYIHPKEIVGSVKTTSKDRIDKVFLDKYLLTKLLGRPIPVVAIFLHDVQRAVRGDSIFGVNSTFKSSHFLGYTVALNKLDGVYYIDPRPNMLTELRLREQIHDFQKFITTDIWTLSS